MSFEPDIPDWPRRPAPGPDARAEPREDRRVHPWLYSLPEVRAAEARIRGAVLAAVGAAGTTLDHAAAPTDWSRVLLAQVSPYRYAKGLGDQVELVATPRYRARGSEGPFNRSALLVRADDLAWGLEGVRGRRGALSLDDPISALRFEATAASASHDGRFFGSVTRYQTTLDTIDGLADAEVDAALVDGVGFALLQRYRPGVAGRLRVLLWTTPSPGAPLVTAKATPRPVIEAMREALADVERDPAFAPARQTLLLEGFNLLRPPHYRAALHLEQIADSLGYAELR